MIKASGAMITSAKSHRILMGKRSPIENDPNVWAWFGGTLEDDETHIEALLREIKEECGYDGEYIDITRLAIFKSPDVIYHTYLAIVEDEFEPELDPEHSESGWFDVIDLPTPLHFGVKDFIDKSGFQTLI